MSGCDSRGSKRKPELQSSDEDPDYAFARDVKRSRDDDEKMKNTINEGK